MNGTVEQRRDRQAWLREWGYADDKGRVYNCPLNGRVTGLLTWGLAVGTSGSEWKKRLAREVAYQAEHYDRRSV